MSSSRQRWLIVLSMLTVAAVAWLLYGRSLTFAFFNDDPSGHFAWMEGRGLLDYFVSSAEYGYYRPIVFTTLQTVVNAFGYDPRWFHALLLALHAVNAALVWLLAYRLGRRMAYAWLAALLFATVPFSYEAVAYVASLTHPLVTFWTLTAVLLYDVATQRSRSSRRAPALYILAYLAMMLSLFSHENGLIVPFMLVGIDWLRRPPLSLRDGLRRPFIWYFIAPAVFLLIWLGIPKTGEQRLPTLASAGRNALPFLQTLVYPLLPLLRLDAGQPWALLLLSGAFVLATGLLARAARAVGLWLFALAWFALSSLPAILFLTTDYLYGSPRLNYLPAVGVALLWGLPLLALARLPAGALWQKAALAGVQLALLLAIVLPPLRFIRCELDFYATASAVVRAMAARAQQAPAGQDILFVNAPFFFSSTAQHPDGCPNPYPWTPVGAVVLPPYARAADFVRFNGGPDRSVTAVTVPDYAPGWATFGPQLSLAAVRAQMANPAVDPAADTAGSTAVYVFDLPSGAFFALSEAWRPAAPPAAPLAMFGEQMALVDTAVDMAGDQVSVVLQWQVQQPVTGPVTTFVHVYDDASGALVAQHDGPPAAGFAPPLLWQPGDRLHDTHAIPLAAPLPPGSYTIAAGLYDPLTGERWTAVQDGVPLPDALFIVAQVTVE